MPDQVPATKTDQQAEEKINFLIGGKHGSNMDTMIIAQVDIQSKKVKMISVPRDTFFNERKLNSYTINQIKTHLGVITGLHIDHYLVIDMYAYIEAVDILGGIDLYLNKAIVDPTYKTLDNGVWSTLNYQPGWHHLSGTQSLRLARSRHTSSDFDRAERQQKILQSLKKKVDSLNIRDGAEVLKIANTIVSKLQTDLTPKEVLSYYFRFKSFEIEPRGVLSTANVFISETYVSPQAETAAQKLCEIQLEKNPEKECIPKPQGQYTLVPKKDWNYVRWYVGTLLED